MNAKQLLKARMRKKKQEREQGISDEAKARLARQEVQREADRAKAQATELAKPEVSKVELKPSAASLLNRLSKSDTTTTTDLTALATEQQTKPQIVEVTEVEEQPSDRPLGKNEITLDMFNSEQLQAVELGRRKESFCLIGGAGTGKTTTQRGVISELVSSGLVQNLTEGTEKVLCEGAPSVAVLSFTNKAVSNIKAALPEVYKPHCATLHKILEYKPEEFEEELVDEYGAFTGEVKNTRRFIPTYGTTNEGHGEGMVLPHLDVVIIEEAGSVPQDLFDILLRALPDSEATTFIFLGDLNQLPPVFGDAVLGYKLLDLPVVELKTVYRQAQLSPITSLAVAIQKGRGINDATLGEMAIDNGEHGKLEVQPFNATANRLSRTDEDKEKMCHNYGKFLYDAVISGEFDPSQDVVLVPFNKQFGTIELNKYVGQALRDMKDLVTYHVRAGRDEYFLCEGDRVMYEKQECVIESIEPNSKYLGAPTIVASKDINRWGRNTGRDILAKEFKTLEQMSELLDDVVISDTEERVNQASHTLAIRSLENPDLLMEAKTSAQLNTLLPLNVLTVHKSQGSEWRKVYLILHTSHAGMWSRELIYTATTRARHHLKIFYSGEQRGKINGSAFQRGVIKSEFKGITLDSKLDYFRNKRAAAEYNKRAAERKLQRERGAA